jgi:Skp family chaperone for outer membrane proteins
MTFRSFRTLAFVLLVGVGIGMISQFAWRDQLTAKDAEPPKQARPVKVGLVNVAKVLKEFNYTDQQGLAIAKRRQYYVDLVNPKRERIMELNKENANQNLSAEARERIHKQRTQLNRDIEDLDRKAQKDLAEMSDKVIVGVFVQIRDMCAEVAKVHKSQIVLAYPDGAGEKDDFKPAISQLKLQTPALTPYFAKQEIDLTDEVIAKLNKKYPAKELSNK